MDLKPLMDGRVGGLGVSGGESRSAGTSSTRAVLTGRAQIARQLLRSRPLQMLGQASVFGLVAWFGLVVLEVARPSPALQVALAITAGVLMAVWHSTGRLLKAARRQAATTEPVVTERLVLRPPRPGDAPAYAACMDADMMAANGWTEATRRKAITRMHHVNRLPLLDVTVIADRVTDNLLGSISIHQIDRAAGSCEMGWFMAPHARGQGYGSEALRAALAAMHQKGFRRITIGTNVDNGPARRVLERVGAAQVGTKPHTLPNGETVASIWYAHEHLSTG